MRRSTIKKIRRHINYVYRSSEDGWHIFYPAPNWITSTELNRYHTEDDKIRRDIIQRNGKVS